MTERRENIARALWEAQEDCFGLFLAPWDEISETNRERWRRLADVATAADDDGPISRVLAQNAGERGEGICRTCLAPIWNEGGTVGHRKRAEGWTDRIERGGDSLVCFKAVEYRHVPLAGREACIYDHAYQRGARYAEASQTATDPGDPQP